MVAGLFDRFPGLQIILGHRGEALPFWLYEHVQPLKKPARDYLRQNFIYTTSGVADPDPIQFVRDVIGADRIM